MPTRLTSNTSNLVVPLGSSVEVVSGVDATDTSVFGSLTIDSGATAHQTFVHTGGYEIVSGQLIVGGFVFDAGLAVGTTVDAGTVLRVSGSGATTSGTILYGDEDVVAGASASATQVGSGGDQLVRGGGSLATYIGSSGTQDVSVGTASGTVVASGGAQYVFLTGSAISTVVEAGGLEAVGYIEGSATSTHILSGGLATVRYGGIMFQPDIEAGGALIVEPGGTVSGATGPGLVVSTGVVTMTPGQSPVASATLSGVTLAGNELGIVLSGGVSRDFTILSGSGGLTVFGAGMDSGSMIASGGWEHLSGGTALGGVVSGGTLTLQYGLVSDTTIIAGGVADLYYGSASGLTAGSGGVLATDTLTAYGTHITSGGIERVFGRETGATIGSGGILEASQAGVASGTIVSNGGTLNVGGRGSAVGTTLSSGGAAIVSGGGYVHATSVGVGGLLIVEPGAGVDGTLLAGGTVMSTGEFETFAEQPQGSVGEDVLVSAWLGPQTGAVITSGDALTILPLGIENAATFYEETILSGGRDIGGTDLGFQDVAYGGVASGTHVVSGAEQYVAYGGSALGTVVSSGGVLTLDYQAAPGLRSGLDTDILPGGTLAFYAHTFSRGLTATLNSANVLTLNDPSYAESVQLDGDYSGETFSVAPGQYEGTAITIDAAPCYCPGTLILTDGGERPVETLAIGARVVTASGASRAIRWIGRRSYARAFAAGNPAIRPVLISAGALGGGLPRRDLFVSPLHAMFIDGVLVPARLLLNGRTIRQPAGFGAVHYIHIELDSHDVLLAEGAPAESFVDDDSRMLFHNAADFTARHPDRMHTAAQYCAPRLEDWQAAASIRDGLSALGDGIRLAG